MDKNTVDNHEKKKGIRSLVNLWPAALAGVMVVSMIPQTRPVLQEIPDLLSVDVLGETNTSADKKSEEETKLTHPETKTEKTTTRKKAAAGVGNYTDGEYEGSAQGYGGTVRVKVTVKNKQIVSVDILEASGETAAFFSKAQAVIDDVLTAQTWEVDVVSGATYSSRGILGAIQNALTGATVVNEAAPSSASPAGTLTQTAFTAPEGGYADGTYTGSATGFGGPITVSVTVSGGTITGISILSASGETSSYLSAATGVISRMLSAQSPNVDTVSGATYSSTGIINAVKAALSGAGNSSASAAVSAGGSSGNSSSILEPASQSVDISKVNAKPAQQLKDGIYTGTGDGFGGDVVVKMTVSEGKISTIEIVSAEDETTSFLTRAKGVITEILSTQSAEVDVVSGATYSSNGIIDAVKDAMSQAEAAQEKENQSQTADDKKSETDDEKSETDDEKAETDDEKSETDDKKSEADDKKSEADDKKSETDDEKSEADDKKSEETDDKKSETDDDQKTDDSDEEKSEETEQPVTRFVDGTYTAVVLCTDEDTFNYQVRVTLVIENDQITSVTAERIEDYSDDPDSNAKYFEYALNGRTRKNVWYEGIVNQIITKQGVDAIDAVSGATYSSAAITEASGIAMETAENLISGESMEG